MSRIKMASTPDSAIKRRLALAALTAFVFTIPWENSISFTNIGAISRIVGAFAFLLGLYSTIDRGTFRLRLPSLFLVVFGLFVSWTLVTAFWTIEAAETRGYIQTLAQMFAMVWLIWQLCTSSITRHILLQAYVLGAYVSIVNTIIQFASGAAIEESSSLRFAATGFNANYLASTLALAIPMAWHLMSSQRRPVMYWLNLLYLPLALFAVILTGSRGGAISAFAGLTIIPLTYARLGLLRKIGFLLVLALLAGLSYLMTPDLQSVLPDSLERLSQTWTQISSGDLTGRRQIWAAGLEAIRERPLLGFGGGTFEFAVQPYLGESRTAHNAFISVLVEDGAIGLGLFLILFALVIASILRLHPPDRPLYLVLMLVLLASLLPSTWEVEKQTWFILALVTTRTALVMARTRPFVPAPKPLQRPP